MANNQKKQTPNPDVTKGLSYGKYNNLQQLKVKTEKLGKPSKYLGNHYIFLPWNVTNV